MENCVVILAAGDGKRMKSKKPKALCEVLMKPMLGWILDSCKQASLSDICVVTGFEHEQVEKFIDGAHTIALQQERKGTGHAVQQAAAFIKSHKNGNVLILNGDAPFVDCDVILQALAHHEIHNNAVTVVTAELIDPTGYGRIIRNNNGVNAIIEQKDVTDEQELVREVNSGAYWFQAELLLAALDQITPNNAQGEYYLTDALSILLEQGHRVDAYTAKSADVILGANDRKTLFNLNEIARKRVIDKHFENGVEFVSLDGIIISPEVKIGAETKILPNTILRGNTIIGKGCIIGPNSLIEDTIVGDDTILNATQSYQSTIHSNVKSGPFVHIRPNSTIYSNVKIGDFVEVKNSTIGEGTSISHLTYVGDSDVGRNVNFGCGVVTVNYDGVNKFRTEIGDNAFIGCNTNLVAPVKIGDSGYTAAGSTITQDVPSGTLGIARSRQTNKEGFSDIKLANRKKKV